MPCLTHRVFNLPLCHHERAESKTAGKSRREHPCGFWYRGIQPSSAHPRKCTDKKIRWARKVEQTSKSIDLLLFADDTTSFCRRSNMQNRKEILKKTFKNWKLNLNDDKWEPSPRVTQRSENHSGRKWTKHQGYSVHIGMPWVLFHHNQQKRLMAAKKTWFKLSRKLLSWALSKKLEGQIATAVVGATLLFGCEVRGFSRKEREFEALWSRVVFGMTRQKRGELE